MWDHPRDRKRAVWPDGKIIYSIFGHAQQWIFAELQKCTKVDQTFCQILNKVSKNCQRLLKSCQSGEISPNLATLVAWYWKEVRKFFAISSYLIT